MADAAVLKTAGGQPPSGFDPRARHWVTLVDLRASPAQGSARPGALRPWRRRRRGGNDNAGFQDASGGDTTDLVAYGRTIDMQAIKQAATEFLAEKRVAVTGVSRKPQGHGSNAVYQRLRQRGYEVFAVNPNASRVEGDTSYPNLKSIPGGVDWVVIGTRRETADATMRECADLGIRHVWMHRGPGAGSVSSSAAEYGR